MSNNPKIEKVVPSPYEEKVYKWYDSLSFTYFVSGMTENNGTNHSHSMSPMDILFLVPEGQEAPLNITLGVDEWESVALTGKDKEGED